MKHKIFLMVAIAIFSSCMKVKKKGEDPQIRPNGVGEVKETTGRTFNEFSYEYQGNQVEFQIPVSWPTNLVVKKVHFNKEASAQQLVIHLRDDRTWVDDLDSQYKVSYQFFQAEGAELKLLEEVEVLPPLNLDLVEDFNLASTFSLNSKTKKIFIQNLKLSNGARLYLEDYSGEVKVGHLQSTNGFIQTFPTGSKAAAGLNGRSGGSIKIFIDSAIGHFSVNMIGESGGDGAHGAEPDKNNEGAQGRPGNDAKYTVSHSLNINVINGYCETLPTAGHAGSAGLRGHPGQHGGNGGDSGYAIVEVFDYSNFQIHSLAKAGQKGFGGQGGLGGKGGAGGPGGSIQPPFGILTLCEAASIGRQGPAGEVGYNGNEGQVGQQNRNILFLNKVKSKFVNEE